MTPSKPLTENIKEKANKLYFYLKGIGRYATKDEIGEFLGVSNERSVRDIVALLATKKPIIAHSGNKGYKLAQTIDDFEDVEHTLAEFASRKAEIGKREAPLLAFREKCLRL